MKCPYCLSTHIIKMGFNPILRKVADNGYQSIGKKQRYVCAVCHKTTVAPIESENDPNQ